MDRPRGVGEPVTHARAACQIYSNTRCRKKLLNLVRKLSTCVDQLQTALNESNFLYEGMKTAVLLDELLVQLKPFAKKSKPLKDKIKGAEEMFNHYHEMREKFEAASKLNQPYLN